MKKEKFNLDRKESKDAIVNLALLNDKELRSTFGGEWYWDGKLGTIVYTHLK